MISDNDFKSFKALSAFIVELAELYGSVQHSLKLYSRLIKKTTLYHEQAVKKHIDAFHKFCVENREMILSKNTNLVSPLIVYSEVVYIDMNEIFSIQDLDCETVWAHILTISALVDPVGKAKNILKKNKTNNNKKETELVNNLIEKASESFTKYSNPDSKGEVNMNDMMKNLMTAVPGILNTLNDSMKDGNLNLNNLMECVSPLIMNTVMSQLNDQRPLDQLNDHRISPPSSSSDVLIPEDEDGCKEGDGVE